jgi:hypothetical protein
MSQGYSARQQKRYVPDRALPAQGDGVCGRAESRLTKRRAWVVILPYTGTYPAVLSCRIRAYSKHKTRSSFFRADHDGIHVYRVPRLPRRFGWGMLLFFKGDTTFVTGQGRPQAV